MNKYALIINTFENNIGFKLAAINTYLQCKPKNVDVFFLYGGNFNDIKKVNDTDVEYTDIFVAVPDRINTVHRKIFNCFKNNKKEFKNYSHFIMIHDDTFIYNIDMLDKHKITNDYIGNKIKLTDQNEYSIRNLLVHKKRYKIREEYTGKLPDTFCSSECYILSKRSVDQILKYRGAEKRSFNCIEEVAIGNALQSSDIKITQNKFLNYTHPVKLNNFTKLYKTHYFIKK